MKKINLLLIIIYIITNSIFSQTETDSLIHFCDLNYHSDFEKSALYNFVKHRKDTFNLFLAIDDNMTTEEAKRYYKTYNKIFDELNQKNIETKKINKQIKIIYSSVHSRFLDKYNSNEFFPVMFQSGAYNCVSASMLYAMVFDKLKIPYKVMAASDHVYLIANPGSKSIVIETTNPRFEKAIFDGEFKRQYVSYLRNSKLISETEYKNKSVEEIFEERYNEVKEAEFNNLPGFQYYNMAIDKLENNKIEEGLKLSQKAYFFFPDHKVKILLNTALLYQIEKCSFDKVSDIDYLVQLSRFENSDPNAIVGVFHNIIGHYLQYTDKEQYCDSLFNRLASQISDKRILEEISFSYFMQMSYRFQTKNKVEYYIINALKIKGNHHAANVIMENFIKQKLYSIYDSEVFLDSVIQLKKRYDFEPLISILDNYKLIAFLKIADDLYQKNKTKTGDKYLQQFESNCTLPIENKSLSLCIEKTYHSIAVYCFYENYKTKAKSMVNRGLKYAPHSKLLNSTGY